jgi:hypothetical protein
MRLSEQHEPEIGLVPTGRRGRLHPGPSQAAGLPVGGVRELDRWAISDLQRAAGNRATARWLQRSNGGTREKTKSVSAPAGIKVVTEADRARAVELLDLVGAVGPAVGPEAATLLVREVGIRDQNALTDLLFWARHPYMWGERIRPGQRELASEWIELRDTVVAPALAATPASDRPGTETGKVPYEGTSASAEATKEAAVGPARGPVEEALFGMQTKVDLYLLTEARLGLYRITRSPQGYWVRLDTTGAGQVLADRYSEGAIADGAFAAAVSRAFGVVPTPEQVGGSRAWWNLDNRNKTFHRDLPALQRYVDVHVSLRMLFDFGKVHGLTMASQARSDLPRIALLTAVDDSLDAVRQEWAEIETQLDPEELRRHGVSAGTIRSLLDRQSLRMRLANYLIDAPEGAWLVRAITTETGQEQLLAWARRERVERVRQVVSGTPERWAATLPRAASRLGRDVLKELRESEKHFRQGPYRPRELHPADPLRFLVDAFDPTSRLELTGIFAGTAVTGGMTLETGGGTIFVLGIHGGGVIYADFRKRAFFWMYAPAFDLMIRLSPLIIGAQMALPVLALTDRMFAIVRTVMPVLWVFPVAEALDVGFAVQQHWDEAKRVVVDMSRNVDAIWDRFGDFLLDAVVEVDLLKLLRMLRLKFDVDAEELAYYTIQLILNILKTKYGLRGLSNADPAAGIRSLKEGLREAWSIRFAVFGAITNAVGAVRSVDLLGVDREKAAKAALEALIKAGVRNPERHVDAFLRIAADPVQRRELAAQIDVLMRRFDELQAVMTKIMVPTLRGPSEKSQIKD